MLKGIQKNMIYVQLPKGKYFESAYFVVRSRLGGREPRQGEMVKEANKIIGELEIVGKEGRGRSEGAVKQKLLYFLYGAIGGSLSVALVWLVTLIFF